MLPFSSSQRRARRASVSLCLNAEIMASPTFCRKNKANEGKNVFASCARDSNMLILYKENLFASQNSEGERVFGRKTWEKRRKARF